jgi:hypothetical protein
MTLSDKFDLIRHVLEAFFYLVTGPLVTIFAAKKLFGRKKVIASDLQMQLLQLAQNDTANFKQHIVPLVNQLDRESKGHEIKTIVN